MSLANWTTRILPQGGAGAMPVPMAAGIGPADTASTHTPDLSMPDMPTLYNGRPGLVGQRVGTYLVTRRLGAGGVGEVFKGTDMTLKRDVAIKVLRDELASDPVFVKRFANEAQLQARLVHPNVAALHAFVHEHDRPMMVMEFVAGVALDEFVRSGGPVPVARALGIFRRVLDGIEHAHSHGIVHRDIKPANIMLADNGQVKVMDFGIARAIDSAEHLTRFGHVAGTAKALSPEQIRGGQADVRSDIYSLGIVLYTLLAGRAPFEGDNDAALMKAQIEQAPPPLGPLVAQLPAGVEAAVMRALEKDPAARFQTVREFARALDACAPEAAAPAQPSREASPTAVTGSRTVINPALQGARQLPSTPMAGDLRPAVTTLRGRWVHGAAGAAALAALGGAALIWQQGSPEAGPKATPAVAMQAAAAALPQAPTTSPAPRIEPAAMAPAESAVATPAPMPVAAQAVAAAAAPAITLKLTALRQGARGNGPAPVFRPGERIRLQVTPSADARVYCYLQDEARRVLRFYPNRFHTSALVKAGTTQEIPGRMRFELVANTLGVTETVACFATPRDVLADLPAAVAGKDLTALPVRSLAEVKSAFERLGAGTLAEASLRVQPN